MCKEIHDSKPCVNYRCPHNLFWEGLGLNIRKINFTSRALEIRNCCCLIKKPWTPQEIAETWGLAEERIRQSEVAAWRKLKRRNSCKQFRKGISSQFFSQKNRGQNAGFDAGELIYG